MRAIKELWILLENGVGIFYSNKKDELKNQFLSMLLSAMNSMAQEINNSNLSSLEFKDYKYNILRKSKLLFVAKSDLRAKQKNILKELEDLSNNFLHRYGENFAQSWDGNSDCCADFEKF